MAKDRHVIILTNEQLTLLSDICHEYKDIHRGEAKNIRPVMRLEKNITNQTAGVYEPDTAYDIQGDKLKTFEVELFIIGIPPSPITNEKVTIDAASQDEAESIVHDRYFPKGYGVLNSKELRS